MNQRDLFTCTSKKILLQAKETTTAVTEPELQLENLKLLYSHFLSVLSKCEADAAKAAAKEKERAKVAAAKTAAKAATTKG